MIGVLEWLQPMLVNLELGATKELDGADAEEDELDADFVTIARPWLHTNAFHDLTGAEDVLSQLWAHVSDAEYLREGGQGGTLLLLLPRAMPLELLQRAAATVQGAVHAHLNAAVHVEPFHPDAEAVPYRSPTPLLRLFLDSPELLVDGSMSDAASFL